MRINEKFNNACALVAAWALFSFMSNINIPERPEYDKMSVLYQSREGRCPDFELWETDALRILLRYTGLSESVMVTHVIGRKLS